MLRKVNLVLVLVILSPSLVYAASKPDDKPQVIKLQRFRKALWKVHRYDHGWQSRPAIHEPVCDHLRLGPRPSLAYEGQ